METVERSRGAVFGRGLATLIGWHGLLIAAAVLWWLSLSSAQPPPTCEGDGLGLNCAASPRENAAIIAVFYGVPTLAAMLLLAAALAGALAAARLRSGLVTGTVAALTVWLAAGALLLLR